MQQDLLRADTRLLEVEADLYSTLPPDQRGAAYDSKAAAYDRMVSSDLYLKLAWGARRTTIINFMRAAIESADGPFLDLAAGTSVDAVNVYPETARPVIVCDLSLEMLRRGKARLLETAGRVPDNVVFLQADAFDLPFNDGAIGTVLCHGALHLFPDLPAFIAQCHRVLQPEGGMFISSLVAERAFGNVYLKLLHKGGEISSPMRAAECQSILAQGTNREVSTTIEGNFAYLRC